MTDAKEVKRILVADRDPEILSLVSTRLSSRGYEIVEIKDKEEMFYYLDRETVDLILLSTEMDKLSSLMLIEKIRQKPHLISVPVVMMTEERHLTELLFGADKNFDDFLVKPFSAFVLQLRVSLNIRKSRDRVDANALTHLPGNHAINRMIKNKIEKKETFSVLYIDINNFKPFNDLYGFDKGDDVIRHTAKILMTKANEVAPHGQCFVGHVGGDDFIVVIHPDFEEPFAKAFLDEFDRVIPSYYNEMDRKRGHVRVMSRRGKRESYPLISCSVAACNNLHREYKNLGEIAQDAAQVKAFLKSQPGSHYLRDRRSEPFQHLEKAAEILTEEKTRKSKDQVDPLGKVLLNAGLITEEQLSSALRKHFETGRRLGQILISMNVIRSEDVGMMLEKKLRIPYVSLRQFKPSRHILRLFTLEFIQMRRVLPLESVGSKLRLGMCDPYDIRTLDDIERITSLKPEPCLALEDEFEEFLERYEAEFAHEEKIG